MFNKKENNFNATFEIMASNMYEFNSLLCTNSRSEVILDFVIVFCMEMLKKIMRS